MKEPRFEYQLRQSLLTDVIVTFLCVIGFFLCLLFFWNDLNMTLLRLGETQIGTITFRYNTAQRRFVDRVLWDRLRNGSPVYNGDVIRTADLSEAVISFTGGDIIELYPNTLVQIFLNQIEFTSGSISINTADDSAMLITSGTNTLNIDSGSIVQMAAFNDGAFDLTVSEGNAVLGAQEGAFSGTLNAGEAVSLNVSGLTVERSRAAAIFPPPGARLLTQSSNFINIEFAWNKIGYQNEGQTRLEVASDRNFNRISYTADTEASRISLNIPEGIWFWRVFPLSAPAETQRTQQNQNNQYSRLTVVYSELPNLKSPLQGQEFRYRSRLPSVRFQWTPSRDASFYILEAANNSSFENPAIYQQVRSSDTRDVSVSSSALGEGTWFWRVTPVYGRDTSVNFQDSSQVGSFTIRRGAELSAPQLSAPANEAILNIETGRRDILFSWRRENEAVSYTLLIAADRNMSSPVIELTVPDTFYRYGVNETVITPGTWYWAVKQTGPDGAQSPLSAPRSFTARHGEIIQRKIFPPDNYTVADNLLPDMRFTWRTNLTDNRFQLSLSPDFSSFIINDSAVSEAFNISSLRSGLYYWRLTGVSGSQQFETAARSFTVADALPPPDLNPPDSGISSGDSGRVIIQYGEPVSFSWETTPDAEFYSFRMFRADDPQNAVMETLVTDTSLYIDFDNIAEGSYIWTVQALARDSISTSRRIGLSSSQTTIFRHIQPVEPEHPVSGFTYAGLDASRRPDTARWSSLETPYNIQLVIARDPRMTNIVTVINEENRNDIHRNDEHRTFTLPRLAAGDYYWMIRAQTIEGFDISSRTPAFFRVLPIPLLPLPQNQTPVNGYTVGAADVRVTRSLNFSWNTVPGANGYLFTISQGRGAAQRSVIESSVITQNSYTVDDLRLLGRGEFYWQVEAVFADSGFIEQRGQTQQNRLIIDIPPPPQIQTRDSGVLYGL
ncbi:MAG: hypothetical protein FWD14_03755 [Treponema sp.]|nr:hypothetical protein [Treponema sp.]